MDAIFLLLFCIGIAIAVAVIAWRYPVLFLVGIVILVAAVSITHAEPVLIPGEHQRSPLLPAVLIILGSGTLALGFVASHAIRRFNRDMNTIGQLKVRLLQLEHQAVPEFVLRDIAATWVRPSEDTERLMLVRFNTEAGMIDFQRWLRLRQHELKLQDYVARTRASKKQMPFADGSSPEGSARAS